MKLSFSLKNKEASFEADVEGLVEKSIENKAKNPVKKTRYQLKQEEEKRRNEELKHKQEMQKIYICLGIVSVVITICIVMAILSNVFGWA
ncbi:MAG: hypothetical protein IKV97_01080 [Clostridia bacterium]|nr:hypothetical protein [Clostridia bacterium]